MNRQKRGLVNELLSLLKVFSGSANFFNYRLLREPAAYKQYSPEAQRIKMQKAEAKRVRRRERRLKHGI